VFWHGDLFSLKIVTMAMPDGSGKEEFGLFGQAGRTTARSSLAFASPLVQENEAEPQ
jgi:hypothetical protein